MKRVFLIVLLITMLLSSGGTICLAEEDVDNTAFYAAVSELRQKYRHGEYWNRLSGYDGTTTQNACDHERSCNHSPVADCGTYIYKGTAKAWQCHGFACQMGYLIFGSDPYGWEKHTDTSRLKPGDIVYGYLTTWGHSIFITDVSEETVTYADCNYDGACKVAWGKTTTRTALQTALDNSHKNSMFGYISHAPNSSTGGKGYTVCYEAGGGTGEIPSGTAYYEAIFNPAVNTFSKSGYDFAGWTVRNSRGEWLVENVGWYTEAELQSNGFEKAVYPAGAAVIPDAIWVADGLNSFIFTATWRLHEHLYENYQYNGDATFDADGTMTGSCSCGEQNTVHAPNTRLPLVDSSMRFTDVPADAWYKEYVDYAVSYRILNGSGDQMNPEADITRAEFVQVLANLSAVDTADKAVNVGFADVQNGAWYAPAVKWAAENGIVNGVGEGRFAPTESITREQMCTMLVRYINGFMKLELQKTADRQEFADDAAISDWAVDAVYACRQAGLVNGMTATEFIPAATADRASVATLMTRFHQNYVK
ncbi:MAG: S-layer homology domain-containing protein [Clostridia bacterium]|nr:S-layer homology domain-containing protein [Clostridia bacterium]